MILSRLSLFINRPSRTSASAFILTHIVKILGVGEQLPYLDATYPKEWAKRYFEKEYVQIDPVVDEGLKSTVPFDWISVSNSKLLAASQREFFKEAEGFRIKGITFPIHGHRSFAMMSMVAAGSDREARGRLQEDRHLVHLLALYFHNHAGGMLLAKHLQDGQPGLPKREIECLTWTARGKTSWDISMILSIAESTAISHIESAKRRLNVINKPHAVVKAAMLGLLDRAE